MLLNNSSSPDLLSNRLQRKVNHVIITDASECDSELPESCLSVLFNDLFTPSTFASSLAFFESYSCRFQIPISISIRFQSLLFPLLDPALSDRLLDAVLTIITQISSSFSSKYDFTQLISRLWLLLPRNTAFDAICAVSASNIEATFILTTPDYLQSISSLFSSNDSCFIQGGLRILESIAQHPESSASLKPIFTILFSYHKTSHNSFRIETFEILETVISNESWSGLFESEEILNELLNVDEGEMAQLLAALRLLKTLLRKSRNREEFFVHSKSISLLQIGAEQNSELIRCEVVEICRVLFEKRFDPIRFIETGLPSKFIFWKDGISFKLWNRTTKLLCELFMNGPELIAEYLIGIGVVEVFVEALLLSDDKSSEYLMRTLSCLIEFWLAKGAIDEVEKLSENVELLNNVEMSAGNGNENEIATHILKLLTLNSES